jgi:hypothetical protein
LVELRADLEERDSFGFTAFEVAASKQDWVAVYVMQKLTYGEMPDPSKEQAEAFASQGGRLREGRRQDKQGGGRNASETAKSNADGEPEGEPASFQEQALLSSNSTWRYTQLQ